MFVCVVFFFKQKTAYEMRISDWSSDVCSSDLVADVARLTGFNRAPVTPGLKVMARRGNTGLAALMDAARPPKPPSARDLGFALGPRFNTGVGVGKSARGVRLLTTRYPTEGAEIAQDRGRTPNNVGATRGGGREKEA